MTYYVEVAETGVDSYVSIVWGREYFSSLSEVGFAIKNTLALRVKLYSTYYPLEYFVFKYTITVGYDTGDLIEEDSIDIWVHINE